MDFCLKLPTEQDFDQLMLSTGLCIESKDMEDNDIIVPATYEVLIDRIGTISKPTGEMTTDADGNDIPVMQVIDDYHANVRLLFEPSQELIDILQPYSVVPNNPYRVFF